MTVLTTERLTLRPLVAADAPDLIAIFGNADAMHWWDTPAFGSLHDITAMVDHQCRDMAAGTHSYWSARLGDAGSVIGVFDLSDIAHRTAEIGFILAPRFWRKGLAREALHAIMTWGQSALGITCFRARYHAGNHPCAALLARLGFGAAVAVSTIVRNGETRDCFMAERRV